MGKDGRDIRHRMDEDGHSWLTDARGEFIRDSGGDRVPGPAVLLVISQRGQLVVGELAFLPSGRTIFPRARRVPFGVGTGPTSWLTS